MEKEDIKKSVSIKPDKVTKPIQLLAAWLSGLVLVNALFLGAAVYISTNAWTHYMLVIASIVNVPLFLIAIFVLQTKFRPELQEDSYYSTYILNRTGEKIKSSSLEEDLNDSAGITALEVTGKIKFDFLKYSVAVNDYIDNYEKIENALSLNGIPITRKFGKINNVKDKPDRWIISIEKTMDYQSMGHFLNVMLDFSSQFEGFCLYNKMKYDDSSIYIGSYGKHNNIIPLNKNTVNAIINLNK